MTPESISTEDVRNPGDTDENTGSIEVTQNYFEGFDEKREIMWKVTE